MPVVSSLPPRPPPDDSGGVKRSISLFSTLLAAKRRKSRQRQNQITGLGHDRLGHGLNLEFTEARKSPALLSPPPSISKYPL